MGDLAPVSMEGPTIPDFVIVGMRKDGKHVVIASDNLAEAELRVLYEENDQDFGPFVARQPVARYQLRCLTKRSGQGRYIVHMTWGDSYAEALGRLMEFWKPESPLELERG